MFHKPFKVKTQSLMKGSDRKKLKSAVANKFTNISETQLSEIIPSKGDLIVTKVLTHKGEIVSVYSTGKTPILFQLHDLIYPTVYLLWKYSEMITTFVTWPPVFNKLKNGADLMLPGVIGPFDMYGTFDELQPCGVRLVGNRACVVVGHTSVSSEAMKQSMMKGKAVIIQHTFGDHLWEFGEQLQPPLLQDYLTLNAELEENVIAEETSSEIAEEIPPEMGNSDPSFVDDVVTSRDDNQDHVDDVAAELDQCSVDTSDDVSTTQQSTDIAMSGVDVENLADGDKDDVKELMSIEEMDELFHYCFLCALKSVVKKKVALPLLVSNFYKNYMVQYSPEGVSLNVKRSSFKKLSRFLAIKQKQNFVKVKELAKNVESIVEINVEHDELRSFKLPAQPSSDVKVREQTAAEELFVPPQLAEMFLVTSALLPLVKQYGKVAKGDAMTAQEVRQVVTDYIKVNNLQRSADQSQVTLDAILTDLVLSKGEVLTTMRWDELFKRILNKMSPAYQVTQPGKEPEVKRGHLEPIVIDIAQRASNKKVTLIKNLETFGISPDEFAATVQKGVACSTSLSALPGKGKGQQVLIQGNQVSFVAELLLDKYHIQKKYIVGLEKAPKSKRRK